MEKAATLPGYSKSRKSIRHDNKMSLNTSAGPINAETADNNEEIEKQFAVKGALVAHSNEDDEAFG